MTAAWLSLLLLATWGSVARWLWSRDIAARRAAETDRDRLTTENRRLCDLTDHLVTERDEAMDLARQWAAEADRLLVEQQNHLATAICIELVQQNDGSTL